MMKRERRLTKKERAEKQRASNATRVWMSAPSTMNDPFDATFRHTPTELFRPLINKAFARMIDSGQADELGLTPEEWERVKSSDDFLASIMRIGLEKSGESANADKAVAALSAFSDGLLGGRIEAMSAAFQAHYMVSCFCERVDSPLLWGHYAANHHGMCVEYPIRNALSDADVQSRLLFPVIYGENRFDATKHLASGFAGDLGSAITTGILSAIHKFSEWAYEREWRLVDPGALMKPGPAKMPVPTAVYCGVRLAGADRARLLSAAAAARVPVYQMTPDRDTFRMIPVGPTQEADGTVRPTPKDAWALAIDQVQAAADAQAATNVP